MASNYTVASQQDHAFCMEMLPKVSRTFALSIEALSDQLRDAVRVSYLLCRIVDTIEDGVGISFEDRARLFDAFDFVVRHDDALPSVFTKTYESVKLRASETDNELCSGSESAFRVFRDLPEEQRNVIRPYVLEMSAGMRVYTSRADILGRLEISDMEDLERYCYFVAGTVGKILTALFAQTVPSLSDETLQAITSRAVDFGLGLQMVNIVKDVAQDHTRGICFLPQDLAAKNGVNLDHVLDPKQREAALAILKEICARAWEHLNRAREYTTLWPLPQGEPVRLFCAVPLALALGTLREVETSNDTLCPNRTPKVSREYVTRVWTEVNNTVSNNEALAKVLSKYAATG